MKERKLGNSGLEVSAMGLGCMRMIFGDKPADKHEMITFLHEAVERGQPLPPLVALHVRPVVRSAEMVP